MLAVPLFKRLGLGSVLGYLAAGALIGPSALGLASDVKAIAAFAEFGVVLLLFLIGLELQPRRLWSMRRHVFGMGGAQTVSTALLLLGALVGAAGMGLLPAANWSVWLIIGFGLAMSSTALALQLLGERRELQTEYGRSAFAILLFQDVAAIPVIALLPALATGGEALSTPKLLQALAIFAAIIIGGRYLLRPVFRIVARAGVREAFTATALFLVLGVAWLMHAIGLSMASGAFLAGVLLAESEYRHELEVSIEPFEGLLLGLFFMSVGMSLDFVQVLAQPLLIVSIALVLLFIKAAVLWLLGRRFGLADQSSRSMALLIPQGGEFAFVLFSVAEGARLLPGELNGLFSAAVTLSMALTPVIGLVETRLLRRREVAEQGEFDRIDDDRPRVIVAGYGRVGQIVSRVLHSQGIGHTCLEHSPEQVEVSRRFGFKTYYGDASRIDLLRAAGAERAEIFVLAIDDPEASVRTAQTVRENFPNLKILARARNRSHAFELMKIGVLDHNRETLASSLELADAALRGLGVKAERADRIVRAFRKHDEEVLQQQFMLLDDEKALMDFSRRSRQQLAQILRADEDEERGKK